MNIDITLKGIPAEATAEDLKKLSERIKRDVSDCEVAPEDISCKFDRDSEKKEFRELISVLIKGDPETHQTLDPNWEYLVWMQMRNAIWKEFPLARIEFIPIDKQKMIHTARWN